MATETTISRPAPFVEDLGKDLAKQAVALTGVPVVSGGIGSLSQMAGETAEGFKSRQDAARAFDVRKQNLAGLAPQVAQQDTLQNLAQIKGLQGVGSYQPFLNQAQAATGPQAFQQYMSPYQSQVMEASLAEFDKNAAIQQKGIADQAISSGAFGGGREGVMQAEYQSGSDMKRAQLQAALLNQGFGQAQAQANQAFNQQGQLFSGAQNLGADQQRMAQLVPGLQGSDISTLGQAGRGQQLFEQSVLDQQREANRMAAYEPYERLGYMGAGMGNVMGGAMGQYQSQVTPNQSPLQQALGIASLGLGAYKAFD